MSVHFQFLLKLTFNSHVSSISVVEKLSAYTVAGKKALFLETILTDSIKYSTMYYMKGVDTMAFSIRLSDEEKRLADSYAKIHSLSLGEAFKRALFEKIEDEYDIAIADEAYSEYIKDGKKSTPITELWKESGL